MPNLNKVMLIGNLTRDPELKSTPSGTSVCGFGMAINHQYTSNGEKREEVTFVDVEMWGKGAEIVAQYAKKGHPLYVEGRLRQDVWDDKTTGQKRSKTRVVAESFQFLGGKQEGQAQRPAPDGQPKQHQKPVDLDMDAPEEDSIPF